MNSNWDIVLWRGRSHWMNPMDCGWVCFTRDTFEDIPVDRQAFSGQYSSLPNAHWSLFICSRHGAIGKRQSQNVKMFVSTNLPWQKTGPPEVHSANPNGCRFLWSVIWVYGSLLITTNMSSPTANHKDLPLVLSHISECLDNTKYTTPYLKLQFDFQWSFVLTIAINRSPW